MIVLCVLPHAPPNMGGMHHIAVLKARLTMRSTVASIDCIFRAYAAHQLLLSGKYNGSIRC